MSSDGNHSNSTLPSVSNSTLTTGMFTFFFAVAAVGIFANVFLVIIIYQQQSLRRSPTYVALTCLAMVDGIHLLFLVAAGVLYTYHNRTSTFCQILNFGMHCTTGVSSYHMVIFSVLRYLILVKPFFAMKYVTVKNTLCSCLMCWLGFLGVSGLTFLTTISGRIDISDGRKYDICIATKEWKYLEPFTLVLEYYIPLTLISGFHVAKCVNLKRRSVETVATPTRKQQVSTAIVVTIIVLYVICHFPLAIFNTVRQVLEVPVSSSVYSLKHLFLAFTPINSALNPFVYFLFTKYFHRGKRGEVNINMQINSLQRTNTPSLPNLSAENISTLGPV